MTGGRRHPADAPPRRWYYGWNIVAVLVVAQMAASGLTYNALSLFLGGWSHDFDAPVSELTLVMLASMLVGAPMQPVAGALADRYPARRLFAVGLLGMAGFFVAVSFATRAWQVIALYAAGGLMLALCTVTPANALIARWFVRRLGLALGLTSFGIGLGGVLLPPLVATLLPAVGWRLIWRGVGLLVAVVVVPLVLLVLRDQPTERDGLGYLEPGGAPAPMHAHAPADPADAGRQGWRDVVSRPTFWLLVFIYLVVMGTGSALLQNIAPFAAARGLGGGGAALLLSTMSLSHLVATLSLGLLTDRFGSRMPLAALAVLVGFGILLMITARTLPLTVVAAAFVGINTGVFTPMAAAISAEFGPRHVGRVYGLAMFFVPLSGPFAFVLARIKERTGSYTPALLGFVVLLGVAALASLMLRQRRQPVTRAVRGAAA